jgi:hypothetical protein
MSRRFHRTPPPSSHERPTLDERLRSVWFELAGVLDRLEYAEERLVELEVRASELALDAPAARTPPE